jgi:hypothetical protein
VLKLQSMKDNRMGGVALIVGTIGGVITLLIHPSGHDLFAPDQFAHTAYLLVVAHALAIVSVAALFLGGHLQSRATWLRPTASRLPRSWYLDSHVRR